ncbi:MAG: sulfatase [Opitutales bacterium]
MTPSNAPNFLLICCDQLAAQALPALGNADPVQTPNIDRILRRGVRFGRAYTSCPLCQPARAAFWTGHFPSQTNVRTNGVRADPSAAPEAVPEALPRLGRLLTEVGYRAWHAGKRHDAGGLDGFELAPVQEQEVAPTCDAWPVNYDTRQDRFATEAAVTFLKEHPQSQPWFAAVDLNNPHEICQYVGAHAGSHTNGDMPRALPPVWPNLRIDDWDNRPAPVQYIAAAHRRQHQAAGWTDENWQHYRAAYYHYVEQVDAEVGRILDAFEQRPDAANTILIFMADHGDAMGAHGLATKHTSFYDPTVRVPFAFAGPCIQSMDTQLNDPLVSLLDLLPTVCELAGIDCPEGLWGRSLAPWLRDAATAATTPHDWVVSEWETEWGFTVEPGRMLFSGRYKYMTYREDDGEELYDLANDPGETINLAPDAGHRATLTAHRAMLRRHCQRTGDDFFERTAKVDPIFRQGSPGNANYEGLLAVPSAEKQHGQKA